MLVIHYISFDNVMLVIRVHKYRTSKHISPDYINLGTCRIADNRVFGGCIGCPLSRRYTFGGPSLCIQNLAVMGDTCNVVGRRGNPLPREGGTLGSWIIQPANGSPINGQPRYTILTVTYEK